MMLSVSATRKWSVDSGASCHMCCDQELYETLENLKHPIDASVGDGHSLKATGRGIISLKMELPIEKARKCQLLDVLSVPQLTYNLLSVSKAIKAGKTIKFNEKDCQIYNAKKNIEQKTEICITSMVLLTWKRKKSLIESQKK